MKLTSHGEVILSEEDIFQGLYSGKLTTLDHINIEDTKLVSQFNYARQLNADPVSELTLFKQAVESIEDFDQNNQSSWFMPNEYKNMDIEAWLLAQCPEQNYERLAEELVLFRQHCMIDVLKYLKYLVDTMRENQIVWGVGRGSSVASYCLFLLGVHKVDSIKYNLDINEFLK